MASDVADLRSSGNVKIRHGQYAGTNLHPDDDGD